MELENPLVQNTLIGFALGISLGILTIESSIAATLKSDADYLRSAAGGTSVVSPKRAARGYIAAQAYAIAGNSDFQRTVRNYAKGKSMQRVLKEAQRGGQDWLDSISGGSLNYMALSASARASILDQYVARALKREAAVPAKQQNSGELEDLKKRIQQERQRAASGGWLTSSTYLATFLTLNIEDPNESISTQEVIGEAVDKLGSCLEDALAERQTCLSASTNTYEAYLCEGTFSAASLACFAM